MLERYKTEPTLFALNCSITHWFTFRLCKTYTPGKREKINFRWNEDHSLLQYSLSKIITITILTITNAVFIIQWKVPKFITKRTLSKIRWNTQALKSEVPPKHVLTERKWQLHHQHFESFLPSFPLENFLNTLCSKLSLNFKILCTITKSAFAAHRNK